MSCTALPTDLKKVICSGDCLPGFVPVDEFAEFRVNIVGGDQPSIARDDEVARLRPGRRALIDDDQRPGDGLGGTSCIAGVYAPTALMCVPAPSIGIGEERSRRRRRGADDMRAA